MTRAILPYITLAEVALFSRISLLQKWLPLLKAKNSELVTKVTKTLMETIQEFWPGGVLQSDTVEIWNYLDVGTALCFCLLLACKLEFPVAETLSGFQYKPSNALFLKKKLSFILLGSDGSIRGITAPEFHFHP
jgi:hypothetical protein